MSVSVPALAKATVATRRYAATVVGFCRKTEKSDFPTTEDFLIVRLPLDTFRPFGDIAVRLRLRPLISHVDVIHIHGIWRAYSAAGGSLAAHGRKPFVVSAHGMLDRWALGNKHWKKAVYSALVERPNLRRAACLRALTRTEVEDYRSFGLRNPIAIIPNGVDVPPQLSPDRFLELHPELKGRRIVLFLSRIHYKKGVDLLARAWAAVAPAFRDAHLLYVGPDFENTLSGLRRLVESLGIASRVTFVGMLAGEQKWSAMAAASVFVLPSHSEGFSIATLEALGAARPVIITHQCSFPDVAGAFCGWTINPNTAELESALSDALSRTEADLAWMGENGRRLVDARYTWPVIGSQMSDVYDWVLGGSKPASVEVFQ
jgi:glycosyltransferase involved in cell wall biosynthesis